MGVYVLFASSLQRLQLIKGKHAPTKEITTDLDVLDQLVHQWLHVFRAGKTPPNTFQNTFRLHGMSLRWKLQRLHRRGRLGRSATAQPALLALSDLGRQGALTDERLKRLPEETG